MIKDKISLEGRLRAYDKEGNKILDKENRILDVCLDYLVYILAAEYDGSETWYESLDGEEYAVESIAIGDDNTPHTGISDPIEDLQGEQINEGEVLRDDDGYEWIDTGHFSFVFMVENVDTENPESHYEVVITNNYDVDKEDRLCLSRISFDEPIEIGPEQTIYYVWDLIFKR